MGFEPTCICLPRQLPVLIRLQAHDHAVTKPRARSDGRTRTSNLLLNRELPYQLGLHRIGPGKEESKPPSSGSKPEMLIHCTIPGKRRRRESNPDPRGRNPRCSPLHHNGWSYRTEGSNLARPLDTGFTGRLAPRARIRCE